MRSIMGILRTHFMQILELILLKALAKQMIEDGADWLDIGGESTRPGAEEVDMKK